jgi:hypothetical protein
MPLTFRPVPEEQPRASQFSSNGGFSAEILINCPVKKKPISTGLKAEWVIFKSLPPVAVPLRCPACGNIHKWKPSDAWIETKLSS